MQFSHGCQSGVFTVWTGGTVYGRSQLERSTRHLQRALMHSTSEARQLSAEAVQASCICTPSAFTTTSFQRAPT